MNIIKEEKAIIKYSSLSRVGLENTTTPLIIVFCPNYEDRSQAVANELAKIIQSAARPIHYLMICLKNKKNNDMILEDLKETNIAGILSLLAINEDNITWIDYPNNFSSNAMKSPVEEMLYKFCGAPPADVMFDISTMPRSIIFHLCEHIVSYVHEKIIGKIFFAYAQPEKYSRVHYAQDVGILKGMFSGRPLEFDNNQSIHAVIFPSRTGHEGKLLCDSLDNLNRSPSYNIYFPIHTIEFSSSLEIMRANQTLLDREAYNNCFYCSLQDAIKELDDYFRNESLYLTNLVKQNKAVQSEIMKQTYLVAPFGSKVFVPVAYFELLRLKKISPKLINIDICHVKGFQYTSVYSIGIGEISCFELEV